MGEGDGEGGWAKGKRGGSRLKDLIKIKSDFEKKNEER